MGIDREVLDQLETLSRLELTEEQKSDAAEHLEKILSYFDRLAELDSMEAGTVSHSHPATSFLRDDVVEPSFSRESMLQNAPQKRNGCFLTPKALE